MTHTRARTLRRRDRATGKRRQNNSMEILRGYVCPEIDELMWRTGTVGWMRGERKEYPAGGIPPAACMLKYNIIVKIRPDRLAEAGAVPVDTLIDVRVW